MSNRHLKIQVWKLGENSGLQVEGARVALGLLPSGPGSPVLLTVAPQGMWAVIAM